MSRKVDFIGREEELELISNHIKHKDKSVLFLEADGGIGKTRLLQEVKDRYINNKNIIFNKIIDYDSFPFFSIEVIKNSILLKMGDKEFNDYLELERDFTDIFKSKTLENQLNKMFIDAFNRLVKDKKFILVIDTIEKIKSKSFWREFIKLISSLDNIFVVISGRYNTAREEDIAKLNEYMRVDTIRLKKFSDRESQLYIENKFKLENIKRVLDDNVMSCLIILSNGKPILVDLTVELLINTSEKKLKDFLENLFHCNLYIEYEEEIRKQQERFEKRLVIRFENISETTHQIVTLLPYISPLNIEMIKYILDDEDIDEAFNKTKEYVFIKDLKTEYIVLHDEMDRLLNTYVIPRIDSDGGRKEYYCEKIIPFFEKTERQLKQKLKNEKLDTEEMYIIKTLLNLNDLKLVEYLFCVDRLSDKAMKTLDKKFRGAMYRKDFKLMKELIKVVNEDNINEKDKIEFIRMKTQSLLLESKNREAKKLIEQYKKENALSELDIAKLDNVLARVNQQLGNLFEAKENQLNAFRVFKKNNILKALPYSGNHIGAIYRDIGYFDKSITYYKKALKYGKDSLNKIFKGVIFNNIAEICREQGEYSNALENAGTARELWKSAKATEQLIHSDIKYLTNIKFKEKTYF